LLTVGRPVSVFINGEKVPVKAVSSVTDREFLLAVNSPKFRQWADTVDPRFNITSITFQSVDLVGKEPNESVLFIKLKADVISPDGILRLPGIVPCLRGGAVVITVILNCDGGEYVLLTKQPRFPIGHFEFLENPAGMLDGSGDFTGKAIQELEEEAGIKIRREDVIDMTEMVYGNKYKGVYSSAGGTDEFVRHFLYCKRVTSEELKELEGRLGGLRDEGEMIQLVVVPLEEIPAIAANGGTLSAYCLYRYCITSDTSWTL